MTRGIEYRLIQRDRQISHAIKIFTLWGRSEARAEIGGRRYYENLPGDNQNPRRYADGPLRITRKEHQANAAMAAQIAEAIEEGLI